VYAVSVADESVTKQDLLNAVSDLKVYVDERSEKIEKRFLSALEERVSDIERKAS
jgi:hypothetical protein